MMKGMFILLNTTLLTASASSGVNTGGSEIFGVIIIYALLFAALYFFFLRPRSKKQKEEARMREIIDVGDEITTIGGIVGRVVSLRDEEDAIIIETASDKSKIKLKKWAISTIDNDKEPQNTKTDEEKPKGLFGRKKKKDEE